MTETHRIHLVLLLLSISLIILGGVAFLLEKEFYGIAGLFSGVVVFTVSAFGFTSES